MMIGTYIEYRIVLSYTFLYFGTDSAHKWVLVQTKVISQLLLLNFRMLLLICYH